MPTPSAPFQGSVEFLPGFRPCARLAVAVFDFDGTLSWLRHGWPELMCDVFLAHYPLRDGEQASAAHDEILAEILSGNGLPSIFQMRKFAERAKPRNPTMPSPEDLLRDYQSRLDKLIVERSATIQSGAARPDDFVVFGARRMLEILQVRGVKLFVLSGTVEHRVRQEAELLDVARYFDGRIFGSPIAGEFSKRTVLERILAEEKIPGEQMICFGDGPVEIRHAHELGALSIAVASDENHHASGVADPFKRAQLTEAGAHGVIPDYRDADALLRTFLDQ